MTTTEPHINRDMDTQTFEAINPASIVDVHPEQTIGNTVLNGEAETWSETHVVEPVNAQVETTVSDLDDSGSLSSTEAHKSWYRRPPVAIGAAVLAVVSGVSIFITKGSAHNHESENSTQPTATVSVTAGNTVAPEVTPTTATSVNVSPSVVRTINTETVPVVTPAELTPAAGTRGGIDLVSLYPGENYMSVTAPNGETIKLPYLRDPKVYGEKAFVNSFMALYAYYLCAPDTVESNKALNALTTTPSVIKALKSDKATYETPAINNPDTFHQVVFWGDDAHPAAYETLTASNGDKAVELSPSSFVYIGTYHTVKGVQPDADAWQSPKEYMDGIFRQLVAGTYENGSEGPGLELAYATKNGSVQITLVRMRRG